MTTATPPGERPLGLVSLTYISTCLIPAEDQARAVEALTWYAARANTIADITGVLLFTGNHFVQTIEGSAAAVEDLMMRIEQDPRHAGIVIIDRKTVRSRTFARWAMAYSGGALFVARMVEGARGGDPHQVNRLLELAREFGTGSRRLQP